MRIRQVDFPTEILDAQTTGNLVVFAGAGVSMDPPSNYPDFDALAARIGGDLYPRLPGEAIDRYLGRLVGIGVAVHEQVRTILSSPDSHPNALHEALIAIFKTPEQLRLVTTNFDRHFTTVATNKFAAKNPEVFCAPALPVGSNCNGIIHLHGSVGKASERLVLTDADFGRAYITEGWATQFLQGLFSRYVILFVGYRHQDMLLNYLARGLTAGSTGPGRFALTSPGDDARWRNLGITPIHYPLATPPQPRHSELGIALSAWAEQSSAGALDIEERIRSIAEKGVPLDAEDRDFMAHSLSEISTLRFFVRHAKTTEWLSWAENQKQFQRLLTLGTIHTEADSVLAYWFAENFALNHPDEALDLVRRNHLIIPPEIWHFIALLLFQKKTAGTTLSKWVPVLLVSTPQQARGDLLEFILSQCSFPTDDVSASLLLEYLTKPRLELRESFQLSDASGEPRKVDVEIATTGSEHWLQRGWASYFDPNLAHYAVRLAPTVTSHLATAHALLKCFAKVSENWDPISWSRGMIESREQDHLHNGMSVLLDIAASVMRWACANDPGFADSLIGQWAAAESLLLQRLATFGVSIAPHLSADSKLRWILEKRLLFRAGMKHESFLVLQTAYPQATVAVRSRLLESVTGGPEWKDKHRELAEYEIFNLSVWLSRSCPSCEIVAGHIAKLKERHPDFGEREHPDMDSWVGPVRGGAYPAPVDWEELRSYDLERLLVMFADAPDRNDSNRWRIVECARNSIPWSLGIGQQAQARSQWLIEVWDALTAAWASTDLTEENWEAVLRILNHASAVHSVVLANITSLLERGVRSTSAPLPIRLLAEAKSLADKIWPYCEQVDSNCNGTFKDWLARAVNHPAGRLMEFYLQSLSKLQQVPELLSETLGDYRRTFELALKGSLCGDALARVILASQVHFLFRLDEDWTVQRVFPLFDTALDATRAQQCWHGFLYWGRWTDAMLSHMLRYYEERFTLLKDEPEEITRAFCTHLAGIATYSLIDPLDQGWLLRFLSIAQAKARLAWVGQMRFMIQNLDETATGNLWKRWLKRYWEGRLLGMPLPLGSDETAEMVEWAFNLKSVFQDAVDLVRRGPYPDLGHSMVYYEISESGLLKRYPEPMANLLIFLAAGERGRPIYDLDQLRSEVEELISIIPGYKPLRLLCDDLARLGVSGVADLVKKLK